MKVAELGLELYETNKLPEIMRRLKDDPSDYFKTANEIMATNNQLLSKAKEASQLWFSTLPSSDVSIKPYAPHEGGRGSYEGATGDNPAYFRISLNNPEKQSKGSNEILTFHEAYPGHHLQLGIEKDIVGLHPLTKITFIGSYSEGWARYSEQLAEEMNLYESKSALIRRGAWPARGLVVDPGLHLKAWTKEQAIAYMMKATRSEDTALNTYRRVIIWPAQLTSYDVEGEEIKALRQAAKEVLGDKFDIRVFHSKILENGSVPLSALRTTINRWIENNRDINDL